MYKNYAEFEDDKYIFVRTEILNHQGVTIINKDDQRNRN